jgi:hypothetical protein
MSRNTLIWRVHGPQKGYPDVVHPGDIPLERVNTPPFGGDEVLAPCSNQPQDDLTIGRYSGYDNIWRPREDLLMSE